MSSAEVQQVESKADDKVSKRSVKIEQVEVKRTELGFVTSINRQTRTFFVQFCKFSNAELVQFNQAVNGYGQNQSNESHQNVKTGSVCLAKFPTDNQWYRSIVLSRCKEKQTCSVVFIDYGNISNVPSTDVLKVSVTDLPIIERPSFGITCYLQGCEGYDDKKANRLLDCLLNNYIMIKVLERQSSLQWKVDIPINAYNIPFWHMYMPELRDVCKHRQH